MNVHIQASFLPSLHKFRVEFHTPKHRWVEIMTVDLFLCTARSTDQLRIGGITVPFDFPGGKQVRKDVRRYLMEVAESYLAGKSNK